MFSEYVVNSHFRPVNFEPVTNGVQESLDIPNIARCTWAIIFDPTYVVCLIMVPRRHALRGL
jgi:hypothetical protein